MRRIASVVLGLGGLTLVLAHCGPGFLTSSSTGSGGGESGDGSSQSSFFQVDYSQGTHVGTLFDGSGLKPDGTHQWALPDGGSGTGWVSMVGNLGLWHLDGSGTLANSSAVTDSSGSANNGTSEDGADNSMVFAAAQVGTGLPFDGVDDAIDIPDAVLNTAAGTVMAWMNTTDLSTTRYAFSNNSAAPNVFRFGVLNSGVSVFNLGDTANIVARALSTNTWYHMAMTWNGANGKAFLNGIEVGTKGGLAFTGGLQNTVKIGARNAVDYFQGSIDEVAVWNRELTPAEILQIYNTQRTPVTGYHQSIIFNAERSTGGSTLSWNPQRPTQKEVPPTGASESGYGAGNVNQSGLVVHYKFNEAAYTGAASEVLDSSGNARHGNRVGAANTDSDARFSRALKAGSGTDGVTIGSGGNLDNIAAITILAWIRPQSTGHAFGNVVDKGGTGNGWAFNLNNGPQLRFYVNHATTDLFVDAAANSLKFQQWHHVAVTWDGTSLTAGITHYVDGQAIGNGATQAGVGGRTNDSAESFHIGNQNSGGTPFGGLIDELSIYSRVLSAQEISDHYLRGALQVEFQVRACDDALCSGESFGGPDTTGGTVFSELNNTSTGLPSFSLSPTVQGQYFQIMTFVKSFEASGSVPVVTSSRVDLN